ncbi:MAG TPA: bifunctional UDP-sugar hydrolase/5'-nucleotidase [Planctomycetota bacterium]|nr:bifunctional UDP-sugar hydrolase/5'-nucleotidase [Planctomycetota bacterium]
MLTLTAVAALAACTGTGRVAAPLTQAATPITLSIVGTNDLHGGLLQRGDRGGLALLGGYVANLRAARAADGGAVLLIDAGDMFQGTLESNLNEGASVVAAYDALGYAAAAIGNHEFDFGPAGPAATPQRPDDDPRGALKARAAEASFPFLAANLIDTATGRPVAWRNVRPSTVVTAAGVRVGIIGVMTAEALSVTNASNTRGLQVAPLAQTIAVEATRLRAAGTPVIVVTAHAGGRCAQFAVPTDLSSCDVSEEIVQVARALPPGLVDVIVAGHVHDAMGHQIAGIAVTEAYAGGRAFGRVDVVVDRATRRVLDRRSFAPRDLCARVDPGTTRCDPDGSSGARLPAEYEGAPVQPDAAIAAVIAPAVQAALAQKTALLGITLATPVRREGAGDSPLGNLFTDAYLAAVPGADVSLNNTAGGLRADLPAGPVTYGAVFEVMPFDNRVLAIRLTGADLRKVFATQLRGHDALVGLAGLRVRATCQRGALDVALLRPDGQLVRDEEQILVATTDFLATGGDSILTPVTPAGGFPIGRDAGAARDVVVEALRKRGGTLREDQLIDPANPRWALPGPLPVACTG